MAGRDDGEFELILGNKQLLSVLFIVIVLLGVFFAMGFLAGRSTGGVVVTQNRNQDKPPLSVEAATPRDSAEPPRPSERGSAKGDEPQRAPAEEPSAPAKSQPVKQEPAPAPPTPKKSEVDKPPAAKPENRKEAAKAEAAKPAPQVNTVASPPAGTYLQSAATRRADAESMLAFIAGKTGLRGYVAPSPKSQELFRVLIGPLGSNEAVAGARTKLADIGIKNPYIVKY